MPDYFVNGFFAFHYAEDLPFWLPIAQLLTKGTTNNQSYDNTKE